jgi:hypothetical protein
VSFIVAERCKTDSVVGRKETLERIRVGWLWQVQQFIKSYQIKRKKELNARVDFWV